MELYTATVVPNRSSLDELADFLARDVSGPGKFRFYVVSVEPEGRLEDEKDSGPINLRGIVNFALDF